ncbi:ParA family protein, partial [Pelagicoccus sp. SDUM812002]|uniref:ParA family protein n=1 Tax=Pelagicoccus sp. SDUM812002 TaxID=3041266 RepID=UPI00280DA11D
MIYSFTNQKGGVGKTTLALNFAGELAAQGRKVLFVDADPQSSALDWSHQRTEELPFAMVALPKPVVHREVAKLKENFDDIVIDPPPRTNEQSKSVVMASDLCVIPVQPSPYDIWAAQEILQLIKEAQIYKPEIKVV